MSAERLARKLPFAILSHLRANVNVILDPFFSDAGHAADPSIDKALQSKDRGWISYRRTGNRLHEVVSWFFLGAKNPKAGCIVLPIHPKKSF